jgi:MoaA/NifB/PqqE/SkfB family radical SAM enzyme
MLDYAPELGYRTVFLNTNGTLLTEAVNNKLSNYNGLSISVSLEGSEALHDRIRGKGSYKRTMESIEKVLNRNIELFIFTTARESLLPDLPFFAEDLYKHFPDIKCLVFIQLIRVTDDVYDLSKELLLPGDFERLVRYVSLLNLCGYKSQVLNNPLAGLVSKMLEMPWMPSTPSLYSEGSIIVMANRDIAIAHSSRESFGKYEPGMIEEVLASDRYRAAIAPDRSVCPLCNYFEMCRQNGMVRPSEWYRDMLPEVPYCKRVLDITASNRSRSQY